MNRNSDIPSSPSLERAKQPIVANAGWIEERRQGRPKTRLCSMAALLWIFPSSGAILMIAPGLTTWLQSDGFLSLLQNISFEQWIALTILLVHSILAVLAWHFRRNEPWREEIFLERNPETNLQNLH